MKKNYVIKYYLNDKNAEKTMIETGKMGQIIIDEQIQLKINKYGVGVDNI